MSRAFLFVLDITAGSRHTQHMMKMSDEELRQLRAWSFDSALGIHSMNQQNTPSKGADQRRASIDLDAVIKDAKKIVNYVRAGFSSAAE